MATIYRNILGLLLAAYTLLAMGGCTEAADPTPQRLKISNNHHYLVTEDNTPFFWLGDTGWLLHKLDREAMLRYLLKRKEQGFNVIQTSVLHSIEVRNAYGSQAVEGMDITRPLITLGNNPADSLEYDYWDHWDYFINTAANCGMYVAIVPIWGTNVKEGKVSRKQAAVYAQFLAERWRDCPNIVWLNGGDIRGTDSTAIWNIMGNTLKECDPRHLVSFHPFGRNRSSRWFQDAEWLDFNIVQSGHRTYEQDPDSVGQDVWRYIQHDWNALPTKPTLDGEPAYENIPHGLHDWHLEQYKHLRPADYKANQPQPLWTAADVRRYAYWSVFAGGFGCTYGHTAVMQMRDSSEQGGAYNCTEHWEQALEAEGAKQMQYLKQLILSKPYLERVPDPTLVANQGQRYDYIAATRGRRYAWLYTYNSRPIHVIMGKIEGDRVSVAWYNPRTGTRTEMGKVSNTGVELFVPPSPAPTPTAAATGAATRPGMDGHDWVLELTSE